MSAKAQPEYWAYVIEFDADWIVDKGKGTVYVGYTARTPEERLESHRKGGRTAAAIFKVGKRRRGMNLRLRQDLATAKPSHAGPWPTDAEAMKHERKLANRLKHTATSSKSGSASHSVSSQGPTHTGGLTGLRRPLRCGPPA